jgi:tRNA (mo5U34)-methyltransferase
MSDAENRLTLPATVDLELLRTLTVSRPWFHQIDFGHGIVTRGVDRSSEKLDHLHFPESLVGKTVLDVGALDGFFSFEAERRGADRVLATDLLYWSQPEAGPMTDGQGFDIARWGLQSKVEKQIIAVEDISPATVGTFDVVLFLGVLYHAQDPLRYLQNVASVCSDTLIVETHVDGLEYDRPVMVFYVGDTLNGDASNFWGPNPLCVTDMLREVGFSHISEVSRTSGPGTTEYAPNRAVFHARR